MRAMETKIVFSIVFLLLEVQFVVLHDSDMGFGTDRSINNPSQARELWIDRSITICEKDVMSARSAKGPLDRG